MTVLADTETWDQAALRHVESVWASIDTNGVVEDTTDQIRRHVDYLIDSYFNGEQELVDPSNWMILALLAISAKPDLEKDFAWRTLCSKQNDYGPENISRFMHKGLILRLHDKVARLENLLSGNREAQNEPIADTYMDIVGYSIIGLMLLDGSFFYPMGYDWIE